MSKSGEEMLKENMAAFDDGVDLPHDEEVVTRTDVDIEDDVQVDDVADPIEQIAQKDGYVSMEDWVAQGKDPDDYMTKEDFAKVGELRDGELSRQQLAKKFVQMESALSEFMREQKDITQRAREDERQKTLAELQNKKQEAIDFQDAKEAVKIQEEISRIENEDKPVETVPDVDPDITKWLDDNGYWYNNSKQAQEVVNVSLAASEKQGVPFKEAIKIAENRARKVVPYLFDDDNTTTRIPQTRSETGVRRKPQEFNDGKKRFSDLGDPALITIAKKAAKASGLSESEYMEQYHG